MPTGQETRVTDPQTGGQKCVKLSRFDLIPAHGMLVLSSVSDARMQMERALWRFWRGEADAHDTLVDVAVLCALILGPSWQDTLARVYGAGARKYEDRNWERGYKWSLSFGALMRHWDAHWRGEYLDSCEPGCPEGCVTHTGLPHIAQTLWHCLALLEFERLGLGTDDRVKA